MKFKTETNRYDDKNYLLLWRSLEVSEHFQFLLILKLSREILVLNRLMKWGLTIKATLPLRTKHTSGLYMYVN